MRQWTAVDEPHPDDPPGAHELRAFRRRCRQFALRMGPDDFFSHTTALILRGAPTPEDWDAAIHISGIRPRNPARAHGVFSHRLAARTPAFSQVSGMRVEQAARAWGQASTLLSEIELIVAADHLVARRRGLATIDELRREARRMRRPALQTVLDRVRTGSESPRETRLRVALIDGGLPEPELNPQLLTADGALIARLDMAYPQYRVAVEYDGRQHAQDVGQFARDADRWRAVDIEGWSLIRILHHHMDPDPSVAVGIVRSALVRAGWRPSP